MPVYSYRCNDCGHEFDIRQRMADDPLEECPVCQGTLRRVVGSVGIVFKGKGFYVTDHRSSNGGSRVPASDNKTDAKADTKKADSSESSPKSESGKSSTSKKD